MDIEVEFMFEVVRAKFAEMRLVRREEALLSASFMILFSVADFRAMPTSSQMTVALRPILHSRVKRERRKYAVVTSNSLSSREFAISSCAEAIELRNVKTSLSTLKGTC